MNLLLVGLSTTRHTAGNLFIYFNYNIYIFSEKRQVLYSLSDGIEMIIVHYWLVCRLPDMQLQMY